MTGTRDSTYYLQTTKYGLCIADRITCYFERHYLIGGVVVSFAAVDPRVREFDAVFPVAQSSVMV